MKLWKRVALGLILFAILLYGGDYLFLRLRIAYPRYGTAFGSVEMDRLLAIPLKSGKTEYELDATQPPATLSCVHALFPHLGNQPCWYLQRKSEKPIVMVIMPATARP